MSGTWFNSLTSIHHIIPTHLLIERSKQNFYLIKACRCFSGQQSSINCDKIHARSGSSVFSSLSKSPSIIELLLQSTKGKTVKTLTPYFK